MSNSWLKISYAGYPQNSNIELYLESEDGRVVHIDLHNAGEVLNTKYIFNEGNLGLVKLKVVDKAKDSFGWMSVSDVVVVSNEFNVLGALGFYGGAATTLLLTAALYVMTRHKFSILDPITYSSLVLPIIYCFLGYSFFIFSYYYHELSFYVSRFFCAILITYLATSVYFKKQLVKESLMYLLPVYLATIFILTIGFFPFSELNIQEVAANRWINLPIDNWLNKILVDQVIEGNIPSPMVGDWLAGDRPPLLAGIHLLYGGMTRSDILYQSQSTYTMMLILLPASYFVRYFSKGNVYFCTTAIMAFVLSSLVLYHGVYVWAKLLGATFLLIFTLVVFKFYEVNINKAIYRILLGASASLAMLAHGGSAFSFLVLDFYILYLFYKKNYKLILYFAIFSLVIFGSWLVFQKAELPSSDRLLKWHLAGVIKPSEQSFLNELTNSYRQISPNEWLDARIANIQVIAAYQRNFALDFINFRVDSVLKDSFFFTFYSWFFLSPIAYILALILVRNDDQLIFKKIYKLSVFVVANYVVWAIFMYLPGSTIIHHGNYLSWVIYYLSFLVVLYRINLKLYYSVVAIQLSMVSVFFLPTAYSLSIMSSIAYYVLLFFLFITTMTLLYSMFKNSLSSKGRKNYVEGF